MRDVIPLPVAMLPSTHTAPPDPANNRMHATPNARRAGIRQPVQGPSKPPGCRKAIDKDARRQGLQLPVQAHLAMLLMESLGWKGSECLVKLVQGRWPRGSMDKVLGRYQ